MPHIMGGEDGAEIVFLCRKYFLLLLDGSAKAYFDLRSSYTGDLRSRVANNQSLKRFAASRRKISSMQKKRTTTHSLMPCVTSYPVPTSLANDLQTANWGWY